MTGIGTVDIHIGHRNLPRRPHASQPGGTIARRGAPASYKRRDDRGAGRPSNERESDGRNALSVPQTATTRGNDQPAHAKFRSIT
ncbi:hypothetical protein E2R25_35585 [Burkholderia pseudomallei]|nr:hypothetical protein E2R25_35585 [Burkholderia pseudomallei]